MNTWTAERVKAEQPDVTVRFHDYPTRHRGIIRPENDTFARVYIQFGSTDNPPMHTQSQCFSYEGIAAALNDGRDLRA